MRKCWALYAEMQGMHDKVQAAVTSWAFWFLQAVQHTHACATSQAVLHTGKEGTAVVGAESET